MLHDFTVNGNIDLKYSSDFYGEGSLNAYTVKKEHNLADYTPSNKRQAKLWTATFS